MAEVGGASVSSPSTESASPDWSSRKTGRRWRPSRRLPRSAHPQRISRCHLSMVRRPFTPATDCPRKRWGGPAPVRQRGSRMPCWPTGAPMCGRARPTGDRPWQASGRPPRSPLSWTVGSSSRSRRLTWGAARDRGRRRRDRARPADRDHCSSLAGSPARQSDVRHFLWEDITRRSLGGGLRYSPCEL